MFKVIGIENTIEWDSIVKSFKKYDVFYLSGYTKSFKLHGDGEPILIVYEDKEIRAMNVVMLRDISEHKDLNNVIEKGIFFDLATPYGYGGFQIEGKINDQNLESLSKGYADLCTSMGVVCEFVRFHPLLNNAIDVSAMYNVNQIGSTVSIRLDSMEQIWNDFSGKNRNVIRKAIKSGVEIHYGNTIDLIDAFIPMYNNTMRLDNASDYYYFKKEFYESLFRELGENCLFFYATYHGEIISMALILFANDTIHYHLSASVKAYRHLSPTNLLLYRVACWGLENGYTSFHLGGGLGSEQDNLFKFKKAFNTKTNLDFSIGWEIYNIEMYDKLTRARSKKIDITSTKFFPKYRG